MKGKIFYGRILTLNDEKCSSLDSMYSKVTLTEHIAVQKYIDRYRNIEVTTKAILVSALIISALLGVSNRSTS